MTAFNERRWRGAQLECGANAVDIAADDMAAIVDWCGSDRAMSAEPASQPGDAPDEPMH
jgi:hypothetical protein